MAHNPELDRLKADALSAAIDLRNEFKHLANEAAVGNWAGVQKRLYGPIANKVTIVDAALPHLTGKANP